MPSEDDKKSEVCSPEFLFAMRSWPGLVTYIASLSPEGKVADVLGSTAPSSPPAYMESSNKLGRAKTGRSRQSEMPQHTLKITSYSKCRPSFAPRVSLIIACLDACSHMTMMGRCDFIAFFDFLIYLDLATSATAW